MNDIPWAETGLHVIAKPIGPLCNLRCSYCFYLSKQELYADVDGQRWRMTPETLEAYIEQYIASQSDLVEEVNFAFQGGEPTLLGIEFFEEVVRLQQKYIGEGRRVLNAIQTNGVLLDDAWCEFLAENQFLVGLSIDGPGDLHDKYRRTASGGGTFETVRRSAERMQRHGVEFNTLTCVNRHNGAHPRRVYTFLKDLGVQYMQFIPIVEPLEHTHASGDSTAVSERSVGPAQYGDFLCGIFDLWSLEDVGRIFVRDFDEMLAAWVGVGASLCVYSPRCGRALAIEHNGDLYACDHFVAPEYLLGNIHEHQIAELAVLPQQERFGHDKTDLLADVCRQCKYLFACNGGCPKDRIVQTADDERRLNYLCEGFKRFFAHIDPVMKEMARLIGAGRAPSEVMRQLRQQRQEKLRQKSTEPGNRIGRNSPCPCGSGRKYKSCCLRRR